MLDASMWTLFVIVMNTPLGHALDILDDNGQAIWKANLEETEEDGDPAGKYARAVGAWHGLSKEGDVTVSIAALNPQVDCDAHTVPIGPPCLCKLWPQGGL